eukprot:c20513_g1_i1.p1 GENE.c20513_g1_i1~~c20513_g1_i1.p1  ORF type:complete len:1217 (+),score=297.87 c20513_g1_i1:33-3683(+)
MENDGEDKPSLDITKGSVCVILLLFFGGFIGLIAFYPSALAQSQYYVRPSEIHAMSKLPSFVKPLAYEIHLHPIMRTGVVEGQERIVLQVDKPTSRITLHMQNMNITGLNLHTDGYMSAGSLHTEHEKHLVYLSFAKPINPGQCILEVSFRYHLRTEGITGMYMASTNPRDAAASLPFIATNFEPIGARLAFPCFDEPHFRANFTMSVVAPDGYVALSNAPQSTTQTLQNGGSKVRFEPTSRLLSPHQTALIVAPLKDIETRTAAGVQVRVWARDGLQVQCRLALRLAVEALQYVSEYTNAPPPMTKIDLVTLPEVAEEVVVSWGLCMFQENVLVYDVITSPMAVRSSIAVAVWQCIAAHWTDFHSKDWSEAWVGRALSYLIASDVLGRSASLAIVGGAGLTLDGTHDTTLHLMTRAFQRGMNSDALPHALPLFNEEGIDSHSVLRVLRLLAASKGTALLHMIRNYVDTDSPGAFREGVRAFVAHNNNNNNNNSDVVGLISALDETAHMNIAELFGAWVVSPHFPLLEASVDKETVTVKQRPFTSHPRQPTPPALHWFIPLQYATDDSGNSATTTANVENSNATNATAASTGAVPTSVYTLLPNTPMTTFECQICSRGAAVVKQTDETLQIAIQLSATSDEISPERSDSSSNDDRKPVKEAEEIALVTSADDAAALIAPGAFNATTLEIATTNTNSTQVNVLEQEPSPAATNLSGSGVNMVDVVEAAVRDANGSDSEALKKIVGIAQAEIATLEARNLEAQRHIDELESQLKLPALQTATPSPSSLSGTTPIDAVIDTPPSPSSTPSSTASPSSPPISSPLLKLNSGQTAFVRVNYDADTWTAFANLLKENSTRLTPVDRAGLIDDAFSLAFSSLVGIEVPLSICAYLVNETHPLPWLTALQRLKQLSSIGYEEAWVEQLSVFSLGLIERVIFALNLIPAAEQLTSWRSHPLTEILLNAAVEFRSVSVTAELTALFPGGLPSLNTPASHSTVMQFLRSTHPDLRSAILQALIATGAPGTFDTVFSVFKSSQLVSDRHNALRALALSKSHHERIRVLNLIQEGRLCIQDSLVVIESMASSHEGRSTAWRKLKDNWSTVLPRFVHSGLAADRLILAVVSPFTSQAQYDDIKNFFDEHPPKGAEGAVLMALEIVQTNAAWIAEHSSAVEKYLQEVQIEQASDKDAPDDTVGASARPVNTDDDQQRDEDLLQLPLKMMVS